MLTERERERERVVGSEGKQEGRKVRVSKSRDESRDTGGRHHVSTSFYYSSITSMIRYKQPQLVNQSCCVASVTPS